MTHNSPDMESDTYCLFRQRLNRDCQLEILKYLKLYDLLEFSKLGEYYKELSGCVVRNKLVHAHLYPKSQIIEVLGKYMRRIKCMAHCCGFILKTIINKCTPEIIIELQIEIRKPLFRSLPEHAVPEQQLALFSNLQTLTIYHDSASADAQAANDLINKMVSVALNLKVMAWNSHWTQCKWLRTEQSNDLYEMYVESRLRRITIHALIYLIAQRPQLQAYNFTGKADADAAKIIGTYLAEHCKSLKVFIFENSNSCNVSTTSNNVYGFLTSIPNLNVVSLAWPRLDDHPLMSFISQQRVRIKKLEFAFFDCKRKRLWQLKYSADSETLEISRTVCRRTLHEADFEWFLENNVNVVQHLKNVVEITVGNSAFIHVINVHKLLQRTPNIQMLSISQTQFRQLSDEIRRIVQTCEERYQYRRCRLIVSLEQFPELEVYNKRNVLSVSIDTKPPRNYSDFY